MAESSVKDMWSLMMMVSGLRENTLASPKPMFL